MTRGSEKHHYFFEKNNFTSKDRYTSMYFSTKFMILKYFVKHLQIVKFSQIIISIYGSQISGFGSE